MPGAEKKVKRSRWSHTEGAHGYTVTVEERVSGGIIYARAFDPKLAGGKGGYRRKSLGHRDRKRAKVYALEQAAKLRQGKAEITSEKATLGRVLALYLAHRTPRKCRSEQEADQRRVEMWTRVLGATKDPAFVSPSEWEAFIDQRRGGAIDARGMTVPEKNRKAVGNRVVEADCLWLRWTLNWAVRWRYPDGIRLLHQNGTVGLEVPTEKNPKRPVSTDDRYSATRAVSDSIMMEVRWQGRRTVQRSYISELLDIANGTARRITAICGLRYHDLRLESSQAAPHGAITWPEDTDKEGREWLCPIDPKVRAAIDRVLRDRPGLGAALVFPSPSDPSKPVTKDLASEWLLAAERLAGLPKLKGGVWHPYRRKWATARKHLPLADVAAAGGWKSKETLLRCYQQPDDATMFNVVMSGHELRERRA